MRKFLSGLITFVICSFFLIPFVNAENTQDEDTKNENNTQNTVITDLQTQQKEIKENIDNASEELEGVQNELSDNLKRLQELDEKIENSQKELDELNVKIKKLQITIDKTQEKLDIVQGSYKKQKKLLEERLVIMYESGETHYLDVILSSKNLSDFLSNYVLITELADYESQLLEEVERQKNEIEIQKSKLDSKRKELSATKQNQTITAKILENTKAIRQKHITNLSEKENEIQSKIDEYNTQFAQINAEILTLAMEGIDTEYIGGELAWPVPRIY